MISNPEGLFFAIMEFTKFIFMGEPLFFLVAFLLDFVRKTEHFRSSSFLQK